LTRDDLAPKTRREQRPVRSYDERAAALREELATYAERYGRSVTVRTLEAPTGIATEPPFEVLVVSPETEPTAHRINELRAERGLDPLRVEVVPHVLAEDDDPISSTRIVRGEIDQHGALTPEREGRPLTDAGE
jgi:pantetheine-phosphate adenylyltransferase